ncbi:rRNA methyltransferase 2, mitochondrial isoform X2 [Panulirus ornatus]|uniref:rRNA methyltransferase 2, mitochondrial isoform X2 n=1 Tax=Panulirus ornatus TaxID=150431 RepID=UPI003A89C10F
MPKKKRKKKSVIFQVSLKMRSSLWNVLQTYHFCASCIKNKIASPWNVLQTYHFGTSCIKNKIIPKNLKGRSKSSQDWLTRQLNDPYVKLAKYKQFRARSAFKLLEIDERHKIFKPGQMVVDCGAAPGAWTQVAVSGVNSLPKNIKKPQGTVIGVDLHPVHPVPGAIIIGGHDFTLQETQQKILKLLDGRKIDVVLSDMAPNATGTKELDHENIITLAYSALRFAIQHSALEATFLCKIWDGYRNSNLSSDIGKFYSTVKVVKPLASRSDSSERFVLGKKFCGSKA